MSSLPNQGNPVLGAGISPAAQVIVAHALETFGTEQKARMWLERPNALLSASAPIQVLLTDPSRYELVDEELSRIDYGVFL